MRIMIKGGVWKNIEDEILKAAVMKYGLNQWSRISSLLVRKSAKQCKARWYEWLDPSIKKTEWSKEEEEKLLHLAKIFPNQWRTIAPGIGRTPSQCIEHYEKLLEEAAGKEVDEENDPRKLRPGEVDPAPETRPPKPDPVDMDEDEKEMLQEARARLSNTRGKKAKRKMREKQLEEGRRLATVQRKRELRASGIDMELKKRIKPKVREMDYNVEIPFEHMVPEGKFKPEEAVLPREDELMISAQHIEGNMRSEQEARRKIEDERKLKRLKELNLPAAISKISSANDFKVPMKRNRFSLPAPQLTEKELQNFSSMMASVQGNQVTDMLVTSSDQTHALLNPENIITPISESTVQNEAYNALLLSRSSTPLVGGQNPLLLPSASPAFTPNRIARSLTPSVQGQSIGLDNDPKLLPGPIQEAYISILDKLPLPENTYEMPIDEESEEEDEESQSEEPDSGNPDDLVSTVVKKQLPRPYVFNPKKYVSGNDADVVTDEVVNLVLYDMNKFPMKGAKPLPMLVDKELLEHQSLKKAKELVDEHMRISEKLDFDKAHKKFVYDYKSKMPVEVKKASFDCLLNNAQIELKYSTAYIEKIIEKIKKLEDSVRDKTKDLQGKAHKIEKSIQKKYAKLEKARREYKVFEKIKENENKYAENRMNTWRRLVFEEREKERALNEELNETIKMITAWEWCNST